MNVLSSKQVLKDKNSRDPDAITSLTLTHKALSNVSCLGEFKNLERLDLGFNNLTSLEGLKGCVNLKWLSVVQNKLESLKGVEAFTKLTVLNAGKNKLKKMDEVKSLVNLRALILNDNEIASICKLDRLNELNTLVLSRNPVRQIGECLVRVKSITKLSLSHCQLQTIGSSLKFCTELKELRLAHNDIKSIPDELARNVKLQNLDLGNNVIMNWSDLKVLSKLVNLKNLNLQGNPIAEKDNLAKKVRKLLPDLLIFNAKPIDKTMGKKGNKVDDSSRDVEDQGSVQKGMQIDQPNGNKKSKKHHFLSEDEDHHLVIPEISDVKGPKVKKQKKNELLNEEPSGVGENSSAKRNKKHKKKSDENSITEDTETFSRDPDGEKLMGRKEKTNKLSTKASNNDGFGGTQNNDGKESKKKKKQSKSNAIDDGETPFVDLFTGDAADDAANSSPRKVEQTMKERDAFSGLVTFPTKKKKIRNRGAGLASLELSPTAEVGLGGASTWGD